MSPRSMSSRKFLWSTSEVNSKLVPVRVPPRVVVMVFSVMARSKLVGVLI